MESAPVTASQLKINAAITKLVRVPGWKSPVLKSSTLYDKLLERAARTMVDESYGEIFRRARSSDIKLRLLKEYFQQPEADPINSEWFRDAISALVPEVSKIDRRSKPADPLKDMIAKIKAKSPRISHFKICCKLDSMNVPLPGRWRNVDNRTWSFAYRDNKVRRRLKSYFSKVRA